MKATNLIEFFQANEKLFYPDMYRGQANKDWPVVPSLARKMNELDSYCSFSSWNEIEDHLLNEFKKLAVSYMDYKPENRIEWLVYVQHYGLPTVLLDLTTSPLKALFFAVENPEHDHFDGSVFAYHHDSWCPDCEIIGEIEELLAFYPKHINNRVTAQDSCFLAFPFPEGLNEFEPLGVFDDEDEESIGPLEEIIIPKEAKPKIRKELSKLGICHKSIFPGIEGISTSIRRTMGWQ